MMIDIRHRIPSGHSGRFTIPNLDEVEGIAVHHSVSGWAWLPETRKYTCHWNDAVDIPQEAEVAHLLAIDRWHSLPNNDWGGFGYHIAAFASGRWYYVGSLNTARAHVAGLNPRFMGLVLIGDFTSAVPRESHLAAAKEGVAFICEFYERKLPTEAHRLIRNQTTTCPGNTWEEWGPKLKEEPMPTEWQRYTELLAQELQCFHDVEFSANELRRLALLLQATWRRSDSEPALDDPIWLETSAECDLMIKHVNRLKERCRWLGRPG